MSSLRLTLRQLQIFKAIADAGSTSTASTALALSQSATSAALNELERQLDLRLFDRVGKKLMLNDSGRVLLRRARALLDGAIGIELWAANRDAQVGHLRIGASTTIGNYLLPGILADFRASLSAVAREVWQAQVAIANTAAIARQVSRMDLDVGLIEGPCHEAELDAQPWLEDELALVCAPDDPILGGNAHAVVPLDALRQATWLLREVGSGTREIIDTALIPHLHQLRAGIEFGNAEAIKRAVAHGLGISCLSVSVVGDLVQSGQLVRMRTPLPRLTRRFYIVMRRARQATPGLRRFLEHLAQQRPVES